ncbi:MAG: MATE family efflux transporter [Candidatus Acidiferrales bacterium]
MVQLALPLVLAELGWMTMGIVDTVMVGRLPNSAVAIGAVSLGSVLFYAVAISCTGLLLGLDTLVSQSYGAQDLKDCHHSLLNALYLSLGLTPPVMGVVFMIPMILHHAGIAPDVLVQANDYLRALNWGLLPLLLYTAFRRYLQGMNRVQPVMFAILSANIANAVGNWALIYGHLGLPAMGVVGSAWATCISRVFMAGYLGAYIIWFEHREKIGLRDAHRRPHWHRIRRLLVLGTPAAMQMGLEITVFALATALIARLGALPLAAHQIALNTASFTYMVPLGISSAAAVRVGQALGRRDRAGASRSGWTAIALGAGFMSCAAAAFLLFPRAIARVYTPDLGVISTSASLLFVAAFFQLFDGLQAVATGALRGAGDTRSPMICHLTAYWLIGLPIGYYLCFQRGWGAVGMWTGLSAALILIGIALLAVWVRTVRGTSLGEIRGAELG